MAFNWEEDLYGKERMRYATPPGPLGPGCPDQVLFYTGIPETKRQHVETCDHCQRMIARLYRAECPGDADVQAWRGDGTNGKAFHIHLEEDSCEDCIQRLEQNLPPRTPDCPPVHTIVEAAYGSNELKAHLSHMRQCNRCQAAICGQWSYTPPSYYALLMSQEESFAFRRAMAQYLATAAGAAYKSGFEVVLALQVAEAYRKHFIDFRWAVRRPAAREDPASRDRGPYRGTEDADTGMIPAETTEKSLEGKLTRKLNGWVVEWDNPDKTLARRKVRALLITRSGLKKEVQPHAFIPPDYNRWEAYLTFEALSSTAEIVAFIVGCAPQDESGN